MLLVVACCYLLALLAPAVARRLGDRACWVYALLPAAILGYLGSRFAQLTPGQPWRESYPWAAALDVDFAFALDGLSFLFGLLITGIGTLVLIYARGYFAGERVVGPFLLLIVAFMASMLGLVLSDNLLLLYVFWELTTLTSFLLIGLNHEQPEARAAARQSLLVTTFGGLALLAGLLLLGQVAGTYRISELQSAGEAIRGHALYLPILLLVLLGAATKSAQAPFHFWLPNAMQAPTPVSAYLHSATMVKAGVYLLARLHPVLGQTFWWTWCLATLGGVTMVLAAWLAFHRSDLKQILAYSTISVLGMLVMLLGLGIETALTAAVLLLVAHALYKGALFLVAGAIDHETGSRDVLSLSGLRWKMPITTCAAALAALSMAGFLPAVGFLAKETFYEAAQEVTVAMPLVIAGSLLASVFLVAVAALVFFEPFAGPVSPAAESAHEPPASMWFGPIALGLLGLGVGLLPGLLEQRLVVQSVSAIAGRPVSISLHLWKGVDRTLVLSLITLAAGVGVYALRRRVWKLKRLHNRLAPLEPTRVYARLEAGLNGFALVQTRLLQNGYLRYYLITVVAVLALMVWVALARGPALSWSPDWSDVRFYEAVLAGLVLGAALVTVRASTRLGAIVGLGMVGFTMAMLFVLYGAPDLAMTQFVIEALAVWLLILVFARLPAERSRSSGRARLRDAVIALTAGATITTLLLFAISVRTPGEISDYFAAHSFIDAHGRNLVNVILVDFRALDTLGEITVLSVAGIGAYSLLRLRLDKERAR